MCAKARGADAAAGPAGGGEGSAPSGPGVLGANLRRLREQHGWSLSALARRSQVAKATLSALESGRGNPTVTTLLALSGALDVPPGDLLAGTTRNEIRLVRGSAAERSGTDDIPIDTFDARGPAEIYDLRYEPGDRVEFDGHPPGTVERVLVHDGVLRAGPLDHPTELRPGDYLAYPADTPHAFEGVEGTVRAALVVTFRTGASSRGTLHAESRR